MSRPFLGVILAAGKGTRFKSNQIKILHNLLNVPMVCYVVRALEEVKPEKILVVVGHQKEKVKEVLASYNIEFIEQFEQKGTAHALMCCKKVFEENIEKDVLVLYGDAPLIQPELLKTLIYSHQNSNNVATLVIAELNSPHGYGRIIRDREGHIMKVIEERNADEEERRIKEVNTGIYMFKISELLPALSQISLDSIKKEYYLTQIVEIFYKMKKPVGEIKTDQIEDILGINTRLELAHAISILKGRKIKNSAKMVSHSLIRTIPGLISPWKLEKRP